MIKQVKMWLLSLFKNWRARNTASQNIQADQAALKALPHNPYLQSKVLWNDLYGSLQIKLENCYRIILILSFIIVLAILGFIVVAGESKVQPYVTVIHGDEVLTLDPSTDQQIQAFHPKLARFFTKNFIQYARSVSADGDVNAHNMMAAYAFIGGAATERLKRFYTKNNPDTVAGHGIKEIHITSVLRISSQTMEIRWRENEYAIQSGKLQQSHHYIAQLTYQFKKPSENPRILRVNPLGFTITQLSWSEDEEEPSHVA